MVGHEDPCMHCSLSPKDIFSETFEESDLVLIVLKDLRFIYPPDDNVMQCSGHIKASLSRHDWTLLEQRSIAKRKA
jgi:hypothetical protein